MTGVAGMMDMQSILTLLLWVFLGSTLMWVVETFLLWPKRLATALRTVGDGASVSLQQLQEPGWAEVVRQASGWSLVAMGALVFFLHIDVDFSVYLIIATVACGVFWALDHVFFAARRQAGVSRLLQSSLAEEQLRPYAAEPLLIEYAHSFFPVLAVVLVLRSFLAEPFMIPSGSMLPTLEVGDYIVVNKYAYGLRDPLFGHVLVSIGKPQRGDIMVFRYPENPHINFIKRLVGLPGDHIVFDEGDLYINGQKLERKLVSQDPEINPWEQYFDENLTGVHHIIRQEVGRYIKGHHWEQVVPQGQYFMMGDNRDNSRDSRFWGFLDDRLIVGKAAFIWMHKESGLNLPTFSRDGMVH